MVAALSPWHDRHDAATNELERRWAEGETMIIAGRTLVETYAVVTGYPGSLRAPPTRAREAIERSFATDVRIVSTPPSGYRQLLERCAEASVIGGGAHDAEIAFCAIAANVDVFLTFNKRHFTTFVELASRVVVPEE